MIQQNYSNFWSKEKIAYERLRISVGDRRGFLIEENKSRSRHNVEGYNVEGPSTLCRLLLLFSSFYM